MPASRHSPTLRRRRLSAELRALREAAGMTSVEATRRLEWSGGRLTKMERGEWVRPNPRDIRDLCDLYGVTDERQREYLVTLAKQGRERGWWHAYKNMLSEEYTTYIGLEAGAATVYVVDLVVIPGLLQTKDYARAVTLGGPAEVTAEQTQRRVDIRTERQKLIMREDDPLRLWVVMDEAALRRMVGGGDVMREQLNNICHLAELAKVTVQVIPFQAGAHAAVAGAFSILQFPEPEDPDAVYVETPAGELFVEVPEEVDRFHTAYNRLQAAALAPSASIRMIAEYAATI
ncbi:helix-turn-helix transcriptional regulator [Actinomadura vinacea]|uniref:Helix-turn-helix transcriptional regulator n=1 Tax=Actinomadura vinacea TaxID=115336 RepID=A0ABN3IGW9_9ACTN